MTGEECYQLTISDLKSVIERYRTITQVLRPEARSEIADLMNRITVNAMKNVEFTEAHRQGILEMVSEFRETVGIKETAC